MTIDNYTDRERELQREIERLTAELELAKMKTYAASISPIAKERDELRAALAERDAKLAALNGQKSEENIPGLAADESSFIRWAKKEKYDISCHPMFFVMLDAKTYAARMGWKAAKAYYAAAGAAPVPEGWRSAVAMAYGHLWHVNNEPMAPIPLRSEESASYAARKLLRDLLTTEERGEAINSVRAMLTASPKEPT